MNHQLHPHLSKKRVLNSQRTAGSFFHFRNGLLDELLLLPWTKSLTAITENAYTSRKTKHKTC